MFILNEVEIVLLLILSEVGRGFARDILSVEEIERCRLSYRVTGYGVLL